MSPSWAVTLRDFALMVWLAFPLTKAFCAPLAATFTAPPALSAIAAPLAIEFVTLTSAPALTLSALARTLCVTLTLRPAAMSTLLDRRLIPALIETSLNACSANVGVVAGDALIPALTVILPG